jgi:CRP-like cAMP-binding protein
MSLIDGQARFATCISTEPVDFAVLDRKALNEVLVSQPRLGNKLLLLLLQLMAKRLRDSGANLLQHIGSSVV